MSRGYAVRFNLSDSNILKNMLSKLCIVSLVLVTPEDDQLRPKHVKLYDYLIIKKCYTADGNFMFILISF
jgi:hypothetical protein